MPTGTAIPDVRQQLFDAAGRILPRAGPSALTSRAVTTEAGCAKGVPHRHFTDFDAFLAELVAERIARIDAQAVALRASAGTGTVIGNLAGALTEVFDTVAVGIVGLVVFRDELRARLRLTRRRGVPVLVEATAMIAGYLADERELGRLAADTDTESLALIGAGHLLRAGHEDPPPPAGAVEQVVRTVLADVVQRRLL